MNDDFIFFFSREIHLSAVWCVCVVYTRGRYGGSGDRSDWDFLLGPTHGAQMACLLWQSKQKGA